MIIRRIASAIQRQDWFTVLIEIAIVVIGLLIGLQVNNWNQSRADRVKEAAYLERLSTDVELARAQLAAFLANRERRLRVIARVGDMYFGGAEPKTLSDDECMDFANMHLISHPPVAVPSITEAFSGGRIELISDTAVIQALIAVEQSEHRMRTVIEHFNLDRPDISQKYPEAITLERSYQAGNKEDEVFASSERIYNATARCHFLQTTPSAAFLTDVVRGTGLNEGYVYFLKRHSERLAELAAVLDGTPHSSTVSAEAN